MEIKETHYNKELIDNQEFGDLLIIVWPNAKKLLKKLMAAIDRPLLELAINILINFCDKLYLNKSKEINIQL